MKFQKTPLCGLYEILTEGIADERGRFTRLFCRDEFAQIRQNLEFVQINLSETIRQGSVRGMHFQQAPVAEAKLIQCLRGRVFDVAVDIRAESPTFLRWHATVLSADNCRGVFIPEGFAHGFQALSDDVQLLYLHSAAWTPSCEGGLRHDDRRLSIAWPLPVTTISEKDRGYPLIDAEFPGFGI